MRRFLLGAALVAGCFSPKGNETGGGSGTAEVSTTTPGSTTAAMSTGPTTGVSESGGMTGTTTAGVTTTGLTTTGLTTIDDATTAVATATSDPPGTNTGTTTTGDQSCDPPCGACQTCQGGACVDKAVMSPCDPPPGACAGLLWGALSNDCYTAAASGGQCDNGGTCQPLCDLKGDVHVSCGDPKCVRPGNPCQPGAPAANVDFVSFCMSNGINNPSCTTTCNNIDGVLESYTCDAGATCQLLNSFDCLGYACDSQFLVCKVGPCTGFADCAPGYSCDMGQCTSN